MTVVSSLLADSVTSIKSSEARGRVLITGSHGGRSAEYYAAEVGVAAVVFNDAGVGKDAAGIAGLELLARIGLPAVAVSHLSARIGDAHDTLESGILSHINRPAKELGITVGMSAHEAAQVFAIADLRPAVRITMSSKPRLIVFAPEPVAIIGVDSTSELDERHAGCIVVSGSHGGVIHGYALRIPVRGAFFNDAGGGKENAGVGRLALLDDRDVPSCAVDSRSARIGDCEDSYRHGVVSQVNVAASKYGLRAGVSVRAAAEALREAAIGRGSIS